MGDICCVATMRLFLSTATTIERTVSMSVWGKEGRLSDDDDADDDDNDREKSKFVIEEKERHGKERESRETQQVV